MSSVAVRRRRGGGLVLGEPDEQLGEVAAGEVPGEGLGDLVVVALEASEMSRSTTRRWTSAAERRESGAPSDGGSQATAFTWATSSGGKTARAAQPRSVLKPRKPLLEEASSPASDHLRVDLEACTDLHVGQPLGGVEDELGALDLLVGKRVSRGAAIQFGALLNAQDDCVAAAARHS